MTACPDKRPLINALADGELDAANAAAVESHLDGCADCAAELAAIWALNGTLAAGDLGWPPPEGLGGRVLAAIARADAPAKPRVGRDPERWITGGAIAALAASIALFAVVTPRAPDLASELVDGHVRSLQAQHLVDVRTSNQHVVKPWFNGKIDFAPPVIDLAEQGYPLAGGRLDYLHGRTVAALVYRRRAHLINLFVWPGQTEAGPRASRQHGYGLLRWSRGGLVFWAVSDIDAADLAGFQRAYTARTSD